MSRELVLLGSCGVFREKRLKNFNRIVRFEACVYNLWMFHLGLGIQVCPGFRV